MNYYDLKRLPSDHPMRSKPLAEIKAELRNNAGPKAPWKTVESHWGIAKNCFNDLGLAWTTYADWRAPVE